MSLIYAINDALTVPFLCGVAVIYVGILGAAIRSVVDQFKTRNETFDRPLDEKQCRKCREPGQGVTPGNNLSNETRGPTMPTETQTWIPVAQQLPKPDERVLVVYERFPDKQWRTIAAWKPKHTVDASMCDDVDDWGEEDESGNWWWPEGWYEEPLETEQSNSIKGVTHWMHLPAKPVTAAA